MEMENAFSNPSVPKLEMWPAQSTSKGPPRETPAMSSTNSELIRVDLVRFAGRVDGGSDSVTL